MFNQIVVCGTIQRATQAHKIGYQLQASVTIDADGLPTSNHADAWEIGYRSGAEWVTVVEDDVVFGPKILPTISEILNNSPTSIVSHYLGTSVPSSAQPWIRAALTDGPSWIISGRVLSCVALSARREMVRRIVGILRSSYLACDTLLSAKLREPVAYAVPSPIDHLDGETTVRHAVQAATRHARRAWRHSDTWTPGAVSFLTDSDRRRYGSDGG